MRSDPADYTLHAAPSLDVALRWLAEAQGAVTPMAGGTELMVAFNTGRLAARSLVSIGHLPELRFIQSGDGGIEVGAGTTFTDLRKSATIAQHLPLLAQAASWTGSIANQNRGTVGGNVCNASPAADTPPVLLAYDADVKLISAAGVRVLPYREFHRGYKSTALQPDELLFSLQVKTKYDGWRQYVRKVGTRNAQAISKSAVAAVARIQAGRVEDIRIGAASVADRPVRLLRTEAAVQGASVAPEDLETTVRAARAAVALEAQPIDDIRSTARYRGAVTANLVEEFLRSLAG